MQGILIHIFLGRTLEVLELSLFPLLEVHFQWFLTLDKRLPLIGRVLAILSIVSGCTLVLPSTSSLPNLYFGKMNKGRCQECRLYIMPVITSWFKIELLHYVKTLKKPK